MRYAAILVALVVAGCDAASGPLGEPVLQVVSGDGQTSNATRDTLDERVIAQLGRRAPGGITGGLRLVRDLYAQTQVDGIAGEQVCSQGIGDVPLAAWNQCDITNAEGLATFFFDPGTIAADSSCAEIRAVVDGEKIVTDVVCVRVEPGPYVGGYVFDGGYRREKTRVLDPRLLRDEYDNPIPFRVVSSDPRVTVVSDSFGIEASRTVVWDNSDLAEDRYRGTLDLLNHADSLVAQAGFEIRPLPSDEFAYFIGRSD